MTAKVLRGSKDKKILDFSLQKLSTYGIMNAYTEKELTEFIQFLVAEQLLSMEDGKFPLLKLNSKSVDVLKGKEQVFMHVVTVPQTEELGEHADLFNLLRQLRKQMADEQNLPPYVLFSDATLKDMSRYLPESEEEMLGIKGVGRKKYLDYGEAFLEAVRKWNADHPEVKPATRISSGPSMTKRERTVKSEDERPSHRVSYDLFQGGKSISEIAAMRDMSPQTIEGHIFKMASMGYPISWNLFFTEDEERMVLAAREQFGEPPKLKELREALPEECSYTAIKGVLVKNKLMEA